MIPRFLTVFTCLVVFIAGACTAAPLPDNPALDKPVTLAVKGEALSDIMDMLEKQTGVSLQVARDIADQKATIFVDEKPLREVMEGLATLFKFYWREKTLSGHKVYEIWESIKTRQEREGQWRKVVDKAWAEVDSDLDFLAEFAAMSKENQDSLCAKLASNSDSESKKRIEIIRNLRKALIGPVFTIYRSFPPNVLKAFRSGCDIYYDSNTSEQEWKLSEETAKALASSPDTKGVSLKLYSYADTKTVGVQVQTMSRINGGSGEVVTLSSGISVTKLSTGEQCKLSERTIGEVLPQENYLPQSFSDALLGTKFSFDEKELIKESGVPDQTPPSPYAENRSDLLALLHAKTGIQIIADHYSQWAGCNPVKDISVNSVFDLMQNLYKPGVFTGSDGKYLYLRAKDIRYSDLCETPNKFLRTWQAVYADQGYIGLDQYLEMSRLNDEQFSTLITNAHFLNISPLNGTSMEKKPAMVLYSLLTQEQRKEALLDMESLLKSGAANVSQSDGGGTMFITSSMPSFGTSVSKFTPDQLNVLADILTESEISKLYFTTGTPVVGIYNNGMRLDKPSVSPIEQPDTVKITKFSASKKDFLYTGGDNGFGYPYSFICTTPEEAWKRIQSEHPKDASKEKLFLCQDTSYNVSIYSGQTNIISQGNLEIPVYIPYTKLENTVKNPANSAN